MLQPEQISRIHCPNPIQWSDYSLVKKQIVFTQIKIYNMEQSAEHFKRNLAYDESFIEGIQEDINKDAQLLIRWRINSNQVYPSCKDPQEHI